MLIFENREKFRVARSRTPPPSEDEDSALAVSLRQEGAEKIAGESDCSNERIQLRKSDLEFDEIV
jgi:hypothetical protein